MMRYLFLLLLLSPIFSSITQTSDFYNKLIGYNLGIKSYSGYQDVDQYFTNQSAAIYYSLWQSSVAQFSDKTVPLIIWLQGGPGAPSQFGCFNEIGPIHISGKNGSFKGQQNTWAWNRYGHLMCVDQPVGVGFSYNNNQNKVNNSRDAAKHFINFLNNFYDHNPSLGLRKNPLYLAGQSYAGHYIPAIAEVLVNQPSLNINLKGVLIGDGWVDPQVQSNYYDSYLNSIGAVSNKWRDTTAFMQNEAILRIMRGDVGEASNYINFIIDNDQTVQKFYHGMNVMNYKQYGDDLGPVNVFYQYFLQQNKASFGVPSTVNYVGNNKQMYKDFDVDLSSSYKKSLQKVISAGIDTLIYNGQNDFIVNTPGVLAYMNSLQIPFIKQWKATSKTIWTEGYPQMMGWYKRYRNLAFLQVRNAGHLVPSDQPNYAWFMLKKYFLKSW